MTEGYPCQRCGMEINDEYSAHEAEEGSWAGAYLCYQCLRDTKPGKKYKRKKTK